MSIALLDMPIDSDVCFHGLPPKATAPGMAFRITLVRSSGQVVAFRLGGQAVGETIPIQWKNFEPQTPSQHWARLMHACGGGGTGGGTGQLTHSGDGHLSLSLHGTDGRLYRIGDGMTMGRGTLARPLPSRKAAPTSLREADADAAPPQ